MQTQDVPVRETPIRLGQFLKLAGVVGDGTEAKMLVDAGVVRVDGEVETRRGRQLTDGLVVEVLEGPDGADDAGAEVVLRLRCVAE